LKISWG